MTLLVVTGRSVSAQEGLDLEPYSPVSCLVKRPSKPRGRQAAHFGESHKEQFGATIKTDTRYD